MRRRWPWWAEVVAGLVVWAMAAAAIGLWILPVAGVSQPAASSVLAHSRGQAPAASSSGAPATPKLAKYPASPRVAWDVVAPADAYFDRLLAGESSGPLTLGGKWITTSVAPSQSDGPPRRSVVAIDFATGSTSWTLDSIESGHGTAEPINDVAVDPFEGQVVCLYGSGYEQSSRTVALLNPETGAVNSSFTLAGVYDRVAVVSDGFVVGGVRATSENVLGFHVDRLNADGKVRWTAEDPVGADEEEQGDWPERSLTVAGGRVAFTSSRSGRLMDLDSGRLYPLRERVGLAPDGTAFGYGVLRTDGPTAKTGLSVILPGATEPAWRDPSEQNVTPPVSVESDLTVAIDGEGVIRGLRLADGAEAWRTAALGTDIEVVLWVGHTILIDSYSLAGITAIDDRSGHTLWVADSARGGAATDGTVVYCAGGDYLSAVRLNDGTISWRTPLPGPAPQADDGRRGGLITVIDGDLAYWSYETLARFTP